MHEVGDAPIVYLRVRADATGDLVDADEAPTAAITAPDGTNAALPVTSLPDATGVYYVRPVLASAGEWTVRWSAIVAGAALTASDVLLAVEAGADATETPSWAPTLRDVADHIPTRTRPTAEYGPGSGMLGTFTPATTPTDEQAGRLVRRATAWVAAALGRPVPAPAVVIASAAAALRAAYWVELAYPERDADVAVYDRLRDEAAQSLTDARALITSLGAPVPDLGGAAGPGPDDLVRYSFPPPPRWADRTY